MLRLAQRPALALALAATTACNTPTGASNTAVDELVFTRGNAAWLATFDASESRQLPLTVPPAREPSVSWDADGRRIVLGGFTGFVVFDVTSDLRMPAVWPGGAAGSDVLWPRFGPDGKVHYSSFDGGSGWDLRKANPNASGAEIVIPSSRFANDDFFPDWDPSGDRFVFTADWEEKSRFLLRVADAAAIVISTIDVEGVTPVWSPDGSLIAYHELGVVGVVSPNGAINRSWDLGWSKGVTWSPDSDKLVGIRDGEIAIVDVTSGEMSILAQFGANVDAVAWRPR